MLLGGFGKGVLGLLGDLCGVGRGVAFSFLGGVVKSQERFLEGFEDVLAAALLGCAKGLSGS